MLGGGLLGIIAVMVVGLFLLSRWVNILNEYERAVTFWLGRLAAQPKGPGLVLIFWPFEKMVKVSLRTVVLDVPPQDVITRDNVSVKVNAVVYFRVVQPSKAIVEVENYVYATSQLAQTTLRSVLGQAEMDELLSEREKLNAQLQEIIDAHTDPWGIKVSMVELKHVDLPPEMQRAMARQAEAEREKRAKIIHAEGEFRRPRSSPRRPTRVSRQPGDPAAALSPDVDRDLGGEELDDPLPDPDRPPEAVPRGQGLSRSAARGR
jgi:regulator of protease activity HflC (stomatin/prohibitin superfamily)